MFGSDTSDWNDRTVDLASDPLDRRFFVAKDNLQSQSNCILTKMNWSQKRNI